MQYRPYQVILEAQVYDAWAAGHMYILMVLATGGGKTVVFAKIIADHPGAAIAIAHRQELVGQISVALALLKVPHRIIAPDKVIRSIVALHVQILGYSSYDPNAPKAVAGVDTLIRREGKLDSWPQQVSLRVQDEDHHTLEKNKWGRAYKMFPNAKSLGVTATPRRTDGKGLGRHVDGLVDIMIEGPTLGKLTAMGFLTPYKIYAPKNDLDLSKVNVTATGEYNHEKLTMAVRKSRIVGDILTHYQRHAAGKLGLTFATDVVTATDIAQQFNDAGIPAAIISANTPDRDRTNILRRFKKKNLLMLVNVDIFGEGFDLPALEVVIMARPTQSLGLYLQQFGRALRPMKGKSHAVIIDHAGNVLRHGLPDAPRQWSLDRQDRCNNGLEEGVVPVTVCPACTLVYERVKRACPYCGHQPLPAARSGPEYVDGDLMELDAATIAIMLGAVAEVDLDKEAYRVQCAAKYMKPEWQQAAVKRHVATQEAQRVLRNDIMQWAAYGRDAGQPDHEIHKRFYFKFGIDIMSAQALREKEARELTTRVVSKMGVVV